MIKRTISQKKIYWCVSLSLLLFTLLFTQVSCNGTSAPKQKDWAEMDCKERTTYIEKLIQQNELVGVNELEMTVKKEVVAKHGTNGVMSFDLSPSIYDGSAQIMISNDDIDRIQIVVPFKCTLSNVPGAAHSTHFTGQVVYQYAPQTKTVTLNNWELTEEV